MHGLSVPAEAPVFFLVTVFSEPSRLWYHVRAKYKLLMIFTNSYTLGVVNFVPISCILASCFTLLHKRGVYIFITKSTIQYKLTPTYVQLVSSVCSSTFTTLQISKKYIRINMNLARLTSRGGGRGDWFIMHCSSLVLIIDNRVGRMDWKWVDQLQFG